MRDILDMIPESIEQNKSKTSLQRLSEDEKAKLFIIRLKPNYNQPRAALGKFPIAIENIIPWYIKSKADW